jgi:hypothetical protein
MRTFALVLVLALPACAAERSVVGTVTFEQAPKGREPKGHLRYPAPVYATDDDGDGIGFRSKEPVYERHLDRFPYGDGSVYHGSEYGRKGYLGGGGRNRDGFISEGPMHYGSGYSSNRVNWDFLLRR